MKRLLPMGLVFAVLFSMVSCQTTQETDTGMEAADETAGEIPVQENTEYGNLVVRDYSGAEYTILTAAEGWKKKYVVAAEENTGDTLDDAVYNRNKIVEELYNIQLQYDVVNGNNAGTEEVRLRLNDIVSSGQPQYDLFVGSAGYIGARVLEGVFTNLNVLEFLQFSSPWWYDNINSNLEVEGNLYICAGAYGLLTISANTCTFFNKEVAQQHDLPSFYEDVYNGTWTYDRMLEYAAYASNDVDGNGKWDENDSYGFLGTDTESFAWFPYGMGRKITENNAEGIPVVIGLEERVVDIMGRLTSLIRDNTMYFKGNLDPYSQIIEMFNNNRGMFIVYQMTIAESEQMREGVDYGILPLPKYDEAQEEYYSSCFADIAAIPMIVEDLEMSQIILEALNCVSYRETTPVYYDIVLQRKISRDTESAEMLDIILAGTVMDFGMLFFRELESDLYYMNMIRTQEYTTWWAQKQEGIHYNLNEILAVLQEINIRQTGG